MRRLYFFWYAILFIILSLWIATGIPLLVSPDLASLTLMAARLFGLLAAYFALTQFMLIGRIEYIEGVIGQDVLAKIHAKVGKYVLYFILLHAVFVAWSYAVSNNLSFIGQYLDFFNNYSGTLKSFIAACLFIVIALLSIFFKRLKLQYEVWYFIHLLVYLAILLAWDHQLKLGGTLQNSLASTCWILLYVFVFTNFIYYRFVRIFWLFYKHQFFVSKVIPEEGSAVSLYISGKNMSAFRRESGQFMIVRFLDFKRWWQAHPFSLSWGREHNILRITPKDSGDFTHEIGKVKAGTFVLIDGMLGKFTLSKNAKNKLLFIAGGIGITPINALLDSVSKDHNCILLYSAKTKSEFTLRKEIEKRAKEYKTSCFYFVTEEKGDATNEFSGRIDENYIKKLVPDMVEREVFLCGPLPFMLGISEILKRLGVKKEFIHFEEFSLH